MTTVKTPLMGYVSVDYVPSKTIGKIWQLKTFRNSKGLIMSIAREGDFSKESFTPSRDLDNNNFMTDPARGTKTNTELVHKANLTVLKKFVDNEYQVI